MFNLREKRQHSKWFPTQATLQHPKQLIAQSTEPLSAQSTTAIRLVMSIWLRWYQSDVDVVVVVKATWSSIYRCQLLWPVDSHLPSLVVNCRLRMAKRTHKASVFFLSVNRPSLKCPKQRCFKARISAKPLTSFLFTHSLFLYQKSKEWDFWYVNNSCINTPRPHFPQLEVLSIFTSKVLHLASFEHESSFNSEKAWVWPVVSHLCTKRKKSLALPWFQNWVENLICFRLSRCLVSAS